MDIKALIRNVAPALGAALGGPIGGALGILSNVILGKPDGSMDEVAQGLAKATPEVLAAVRAADQKFAEDMKGLDIDLEKIAESDRESARARQVALKDPTTTAMAVFTNLMFAGAFYVVCVHGVPPASKDLANIMFGGLIAMATGVNTYYFGSSAGSRAKDDTIKALSS